jgi:hypothetical protein
MTKRFTDLLMLPITLGVLGLMAMGLFAMQTMTISLNGRVCNESSSPIWLTVTELGRQKAYSLPPGDCTDVLTQDAEAIWGKNCETNPCKYQAWKVSAGRFDVDNDGASVFGSVLRIKGWGAGSHWHITQEWPKPGLSAIDYSLVR